MIIGSGGREHAIGWKLKQSPKCGSLFFVPGNAGTKQYGKNVNIDLAKIDQKTVDAIAFFCRDNKIELVVIGPEDPLAAGLTDKLQAWGDKDLKVFGPTMDGARLEADKGWSKQMMRGVAVPTAEGRIFTDSGQAMAYVTAHETPVVVKAAGLAKGKGVIVTDSPEEAMAAVKRVMIDKEFGDAGGKCVVEERLTGQEVSVLALVDGHNIYVLDPAQDHKQVGEGDTGANTGGMGAYTPTPVVSEEMLRQIEAEVLVPMVDGLRREGIEYKGVLYAGIMLTPGGPKVLEFNCRFGDPETQAILARFNGDLLDVMLAVVDGKLDQVGIGWDERVACCVVICSGGYPGDYKKGLPISGLDEAAKMKDVHVFHAGTTEKDGVVVTAGGRVINVVGLGATIKEARDRANAACAKIKFAGAFYRHDIGDRVLKKG